MAQLPGSKIILMGESGSGKTYSIRTLLKAGIRPMVLFTEPGMETLSDIPKDKWSYAYIKPSTDGWENLISSATKVNTLNFDTLSKMGDVNRSKHTQFIDVLNICKSFVDHEGKDWGPVQDWGTDRCLVIDSLSGLSDMIMQLVVGSKPVRQLQDWMIAQNTLEAFVNKCVTDLNCWFVLITHVEREKDEISGGMNIMVSTLGRKLAPKLPKYFSDAILAHRIGKDFYWSTAESNAAVKSRNLPISDKLQPDFSLLVKEWEKKGGVIAPPVVPTSST